MARTSAQPQVQTSFLRSNSLKIHYLGIVYGVQLGPREKSKGYIGSAAVCTSLARGENGVGGIALWWKLEGHAGNDCSPRATEC